MVNNDVLDIKEITKPLETLQMLKKAGALNNRVL